MHKYPEPIPRTTRGGKKKKNLLWHRNPEDQKTIKLTFKINEVVSLQINS
jgi:hypothetical protein